MSKTGKRGNIITTTPPTVWNFACENAFEAVSARAGFIDALQNHCRFFVNEESAVAVFNELVANVAQHAPGSIQMSLQVRERVATLTVNDTGPGFVYDPTLPADLFCEHGRGLFLLAAFGGGVTVTARAHGGSSVCATLAGPRKTRSGSYRK